MKILVPIDFSLCSESAYRYAQQYAQAFEDSHIILYHSVMGAVDMSVSMNVELIESYKVAAKGKLESLAEKQLITDFSLENITQIIEFGLPSMGILETMKSEKVDLIIMGTRDKHNVLDKIFGSTSTNVLNRASVPVIYVHENTTYRNIEKSIFAFDLTTELDQPIQQFSKLNHPYLSTTTFLHVGHTGMEVLPSIENIIRKLHKDGNPMYSYDADLINGSNIATAVIDYCIMKKADILALAHGHKGVWKSIFSTDMSESIIHQFHLPVMVLPSEA